VPEGHTIHRLARDHPPLLVGGPVCRASPPGQLADGAALLTGRTCTRIEPYGKHLWYLFDGDLSLHVHLGLYGKWTGGTGPPPEVRGQLRLRMTAGSGTDTAWLDLRGPTACEVHTRADQQAVLARLGPDPLRRTDDGERAWQRLSRSRTSIGQLLMDQTVLAGVGNVYRAELLFRARLSPFTPGREVPRDTWDRMWTDLRGLMRAGVKANRIVTTGARAPVRREDAHYVYRRAGEPCRLCNTLVRTQVVAGRNLFWCPVDQPA
jgi:formamidopyrimidine-DNA glycosylase